MQYRDRNFVLIGMLFLFVLLTAISAIGREYSSEPAALSETKPADGSFEPSHSTHVNALPKSKAPAICYSTENMAESGSGTGSNAVSAEAQDYMVFQTGATLEIPAVRRPGIPAGYRRYGSGYPILGGTLHIRPGPYLAGQCLCSDGDRESFWPVLWDTDISYSWSGNSGSGELTYWPYGYRYSWGNNPDDSDAHDLYQSHSATESEPNTISDDYTQFPFGDPNE